MNESDDVRQLDLELDGRTLHAYDRAPDGGTDALAVLWCHGTPNTGPPPAPLFPASDLLGVRWFSYDRPGYGGSARHLARDVASAATDAAAVADALGVERFVVFGHSGGGPHALACAALLPHRVLGVVVVAGLAPFGAGGLDWFTGMAPAAVASLTAALAGPEVKERYEAGAPESDAVFTEEDHAALAGEWSWFKGVVAAGLAGGVGGLVDDDIAFVTPWGFSPEDVAPPVLLLHGGKDRMVPSSHSEWLAERLGSAELRLAPGEGHISVMRGAPAALEWLRGVAEPRGTDGRRRKPA